MPILNMVDRPKRACVFAHFDPDGIVDPHVVFLLNGLKEVTDRLIFVTTSATNVAYLDSLRLPASITIIRENRGFDFSSWKIGLDQLDWAAFDEIVLCNDSVYGPLFPLKTLFERMQGTSCDFWGVTDNTEYSYHLQSYFLVFKANVITSKVFRDFWVGVEPLEQKQQVIMRCELGLTARLMAHGFKPAAAFRPNIRYSLTAARVTAERVVSYLLRWPGAVLMVPSVWRRNARLNKTNYLWKEMLRQKLPFIKVEFLRTNPKKRRVNQAFRQVHEQTDYPTGLISSHVARTGSRRLSLQDR